MLAACSGSKKGRAPTDTPGAGSGATATAAVSPPAPAATVPAQNAELSGQIGVRAALPLNRPIDLAAAYGRTRGPAPAAKPFAGEANLGDHRAFTVVELSTGVLEGTAPPGVRAIDGVLLGKSAHAYFYQDAAIGSEAASVQAAADLFEATVWPTVIGVFGEPAAPGVDGDPRIIVLQADLGGAAGGYFQTDDLYLRAVHPLSNEAEMVYIDRTLKPGTAAFNVVLAHEFQHLIHARNDIAEESWVNEGLSEDASGLVGAAVSSVNSFEAHPETQLNDWTSTLVHYGAGAAFFRYFASRCGGDPTLGALARAQQHGAAGVDEVLASMGQPLPFRDVFADWAAANILNRDDGPYGNPGHPLDLRINDELTAGAAVDGTAAQFGTNYYRLGGLDQGEYTLRFDGQPGVRVLPTDPPPGSSAMLWGNAEDGIDTRLTRAVDLTGATDPVLTFQTWFDMERWYDWGYVAVSTDGGASWQALPGGRSSASDPVQVALGPGYTGKSGDGADPAWVTERVSLAKYAGQKVLVRFEYVTDGGTHREGWSIANVAIEGTSFRDPTLSDPEWQSEGWVRIDRPLPQTYVVRLIESRADGTASVLDVPLDAANRGVLRFSAAGVESATLAIAGSTEGTNQKAAYRMELGRP